jgi:hypothetical protein
MGSRDNETPITRPRGSHMTKDNSTLGVNTSRYRYTPVLSQKSTGSTIEFIWHIIHTIKLMIGVSDKLEDKELRQGFARAQDVQVILRASSNRSSWTTCTSLLLLGGNWRQVAS